MSLGGLPDAHEGSVNGDIFLHYLRHFLVPQLKPGQYVIMDNVAFHKMKAVKDIIERCGAKVVYLPPYSPDFNPIELMWSKLKSSLRKTAARCKQTFQKAMQNAFISIQPSDLAGWFKHCGYSRSVNF